MDHSAGFLDLVNRLRAEVSEITASDLPATLGRTEGAVLVDVREDDEWRAGHVSDAVHIGKGVIERDIESLYPDRNTPLFLYCGGGYRSVIAAHSLQAMGYRCVCSVDGGWRELQLLLPCKSG